MQAYAQRVRDNILPLSVGRTLPEAFEEWSFTEQTVDHEHPTAACELCDKDELRYHFLIKNALTSKTLWVGSHCILKFNVSVFDGTQKLSPGEAKKKLDRLTQKMQLDSCLKALHKLADSTGEVILKNALAYYTKNKYLTPKYAFVVLWKLKDNHIDHHPSFFKLDLKKQKCKDDLKNMKLNHVHRLWPALTSSQKKIALKFGHTAPKLTE